MGVVVSLRRSERQPWLICFNLRAERLDPKSPMFCARGREAEARLRSILPAMRRAKWRVVHILDENPDRDGGPIAGLEPLASEPVFERRRGSAFTNADFRRAIEDARGAPILLAGFDLEDAIFSTLAVARDEGFDVGVIGDATASRSGSRERDRALVEALSAFGSVGPTLLPLELINGDCS